jgi:hypothetical protein
MIEKLNLNHLRNSEYYQFIVSANNLFVKHGIDRDNLGSLYDDLDKQIKEAEIAMAIEKKNEKIREKNEADRYRDKLHSKLFNYVKSIVYDEKDPRFNDAQQIMKVMKEAGNPTQLAENAESAMLTALGNRLEPYRRQTEAIAAQSILDALMEANRQFIVLETEAREITASQKLDAAPSMSALRKQIDPVYRNIVSAINGYSVIPAKKETYREIVTEMNVLVNKYENLLASRKSNG